MKQTLQLRLGQSLTMTPQLQQAIRLLQLSTLDLQTEIQQTIDANPMLEVNEDEGPDSQSSEDWDNQNSPKENGEDQDPSSFEESVGVAGDNQPQVDSVQERDSEVQIGDIIPNELPVDSVWEDIYDSPIPVGSNTSQEFRGSESQDSSSETLREHLLWQMRMTSFSDKDMTIAVSIIDSINEHGYLITTLEDIHQDLVEEIDIDPEEIEAVLHRIHNFDPVGVGARDLKESMMIQLLQLDDETPWLKETKIMVKDFLQILGNRDFTQLMRKMKCTKEDLQQIIALAQSLNPRPGGLIASKPSEYIIPDVIVKKEKDKWRVELNSDAVPRVRINSEYAGLVKRADNSSDNTYLRNHLQEARWFIKSLRSRNETLLKVATCIVERQREFLEHGEEAMKALVLHDVAEVVEMHESTISRVTTQKYMHTPRGIFELKYFFSSHVTTTSGGECSATAIRALLKKLVAAEDPSKPLSDSKLAEILAQQGINVARRTIAKYRESVTIPSSNERKRLA